MFKKIFRKPSVKAISPTDDKAVIHAARLEARRQRELGATENQIKHAIMLETKYQMNLMNK